ncbi:MAG: hypothetical protein ACHP7C_10335, partial [Lysobacterales bacterium]
FSGAAHCENVAGALDHARAQSVMLATWPVLDGKRPDPVYLALLAIQTGAARDCYTVAHPDRLSKQVNPYQSEGNVPCLYALQFAW